MKHFLYIIYSKSKDAYYVRESHNVEERLIKHNNHLYKGGYTKLASDWEIALSFECNNKYNAVYLEKFIKRMKSKKFITKIIQNPDILKDILNKK